MTRNREGCLLLLSLQSNAMAASMALTRSSSSKGFSKNSVAPPFIVHWSRNVTMPGQEEIGNRGTILAHSAAFTYVAQTKIFAGITATNNQLLSAIKSKSTLISY